MVDISGWNHRATYEELWGDDRQDWVYGSDLREDVSGSSQAFIETKNALIAECHREAHRLLPFGAIYEMRLERREKLITVAWRCTQSMQQEPMAPPPLTELLDEGVYRRRYRVQGGE
jgi:hypothetical protein